MFVIGNPLQPSPMFASKAWSYPSEVPLRRNSVVWLLALPTDNRLGWKGMPSTNTLDYYKDGCAKFYNIGPWWLPAGSFCSRSWSCRCHQVSRGHCGVDRPAGCWSRWPAQAKRLFVQATFHLMLIESYIRLPIYKVWQFVITLPFLHLI